MYKLSLFNVNGRIHLSHYCYFIIKSISQNNFCLLYSIFFLGAKLYKTGCSFRGESLLYQKFKICSTNVNVYSCADTM